MSAVEPGSKLPGRLSTVAIFFALAVVAASRTIIAAVLPPLGREMGLGETAIGLLFTTGAFALMVCGPLWGRMSDRYGRKRVATIGLVSLAVTNLAFMAIAQHASAGEIPITLAFTGLILSRAFFGLGSGAVQPAGQAWLIDRAPVDHRIAAVSLAASAFSLGGVMGPAVGGLLAAISLFAPFWFSAGAAGVAFFGLLLIPEPRHGLTSKPVGRLKWRDSRVCFDLIVRAVLFSSFAGIQQTAGFFFQDRLGLTAQETAQTVGIGLVGMALASLAAQVIAPRLRRLSPRDLLLLSGPLGFGGYLVLWVGVGLPMLCFGLILLGASFGFWGPATAAAPAMAIRGDEQGALAGLSATASGLGFVIGPLAATAIYDISPAALFPVNIAILGVLAVFVIRKRAMDRA